MGECFTLRRNADPHEEESAVKFRLYYEGPLYAANVRDFASDKRSSHKHDLRRQFHRQLKHFWETHLWLRDSKGGRSILGLPPRENDPHDYKAPLVESIAEAHEINGRHFVPLVCEQFHLLCELDILLLRRDRPGGIIQARDIDNRLKTLFDALRMPKPGVEIASAVFEPNEDPMFVLLQDDSLITRVTVETDELLDPPPESGKDDAWVRLLVHVKLHPYRVGMFNLSFA